MIATAFDPGRSGDALDEGPIDRAWRREMTEAFGSVRAAPSFADAIQGMVGAIRARGADAAREVADTLRRAGYPGVGPGQFQTPGVIGLPELLGRAGTEGISGGPTYGFLVKPEWAGDGTIVADRQRHQIGPWSFCNIWEVDVPEFHLPINAEATSDLAGQFGGLLAKVGFGHGELTSWQFEADGAVGDVAILTQRCVLYTKLSRDLWQDSASISRWLWYACVVGFRNVIEAAMLTGGRSSGAQGPPVGPVPVVGHRAAVGVPRTTPGTITPQDIDNLFAAIATGNQQDCVFHCSRSVYGVLRKLAVAGVYPVLEFSDDWRPGEVTRYATIYGRPVIPSPYLPPVGTPGDICLVSWSDYILTWRRPSRTFHDNSVVPPGALELQFGAVPDRQHTGFIGAPVDATEMRLSEHLFWDQEVLAVQFKARLGGDFVWPSTATEGGTVVGPAAYLVG